jgi:translation elongation factor EF-1alpha
VDCGKSSTAGHLYALTGGLSEHELDKLQKDQTKKTQMWSRVLDIWEEEQERGKTHEFNLLPLTYNGNEYQMIDTPGHQLFIRSLIEGISYFNSNEIIGCLILSMAGTEFESGFLGGQTKEDIIIARSIGIDSLIVLCNKMDTINWDQEKYDRVVKKVSPFINACKFNNVHYIPISGYDGINLVNNHKSDNWYNGGTLMEIIESVELSDPEPLTIDFSQKWNLAVIDMRVLWAPYIIAPGFKCVMHYNGQEYEVIFAKFKKQKFLKERVNDVVVIKTAVPVQSESVQDENKSCPDNEIIQTNRALFRYSDKTIGFGIIKQIKLC